MAQNSTTPNSLAPNSSAPNSPASPLPISAIVIPVTPYQQNCSLVWCTQTMRGAVIDPGGELERIRNVAAERGVTIEKVLLTHGHLDHAGGATGLARVLNVPIEGPHQDDLFLLEDLSRHAKRPGFSESESCQPDRWLADGDTVTFGAAELGVRHCPGHTPGHVVLYHAGAKIAFVGDVLFAGSVGRTDFPKGNHAQLVDSITTRLWPLGDEMRFVPGHGQMSNFGWERKTNPYVSDLALGRD
ncbi:MAG: MBL fold metallo-hydrolase [Alphaproteobacteria bacterium]|nr:MBL fold metallo-hydrolase [Alphaproteobacteria bacterium]